MNINSRTHIHTHNKIYICVFTCKEGEKICEKKKRNKMATIPTHI